MKDVKEEFPVLKNHIYANTAAIGLIAKSMVQWRHRHDMDFLHEGSLMMEKGFKILDETKRTIGEFFTCASGNIALTQNFSIGLNLLLEGLDKTHNVLLLNDDYPSVNWPFENRGFKIFYANLDENLEDNIYRVIKSKKITILALSVVQWQTGIKIDLDFLKKLKREFPSVLIIGDGTQFLGTTEFDFSSSGIDVLGTSAYKWLLSGYGNGFFLFKENAKRYFKMKCIGFNATDADKEKRNTIEFARHLEPGHLDALNFGNLKFSLDSFKSLGMSAVAEQNKKLREKAKNVFMNFGLLNEKLALRKDHGNIFNIKGDDKLFQQLSDNKVICVRRGDGIRLSFHFYNSEHEIDEIARILRTAL